MTTTTFTIGRGKDRPHGWPVEVPVGDVQAVATTLQEHAGREAWASLHTWRGDYRETERWLSSCGVLLDVDTPNHSDVPPDLADSIDDELHSERPALSCNLAHRTPGGLRFVYVWARPVVDADQQRDASRECAHMTRQELARLGWTGIDVDDGPTADLARFCYSPRAFAKGRQRDDVVHTLRPEPHCAPVLAAMWRRRQAQQTGTGSTTAQPAGAGASSSSTSSTGQPGASDELRRAAERFNDDHALDLPDPGTGTCPICGHHECFGKLDDNADRWCCWSGNHGDTGVLSRDPTKTFHHGDSLDLAAHKAGLSRHDLLVREGYLTDSTSRTAQPAAGAVSVTDTLDALRSLPDGADLHVVGEALRAVAAGAQGLDALARGLLREGLAQELKRIGAASPAALADAALAGAGAAGDDNLQGSSLDLDDPELWPDPVDGAQVLDALADAVRRHVVVGQQVPEAVALWILAAHAVTAFDVAAYLAITSPTKRCGKSTLLRLVGALVPKPLAVAGVSPAALFRSIEKWSPTLLLDEADSVLKENEDLRTALNAGVGRREAFIVRCVGDAQEPRRFSVYGPKAIALIGALPDTLADRAIPADMRRKSTGEHVAKLRDRDLRALDPLRRQAWTWAQQHLGELRRTEPRIPDLGSDRAQDLWEPLLAVADLAGGTWPARARAAAVALSGQTASAEPDQPGLRLLADLYKVFLDAGDPEHMATSAILARLVTDPELPWATWSRGRPLDAPRLGRLLKPFGVRPTEKMTAGERAKGYSRQALADPWARYLSTGSSPGGVIYPRTLAPQRNHSGNAENLSAESGPITRINNQGMSNDNEGVRGSADKIGGTGQAAPSGPPSGQGALHI